MQEVSINISIFVFLDEESKQYMAYCPSLDLIGYADTEQGVREDFEYVLNDYLKYCTEEETLEQDLTAHGWKLVGDTLAEPNFLSLLENNETLASLITTRKDYYCTHISRTLTKAANALQQGCTEK